MEQELNKVQVLKFGGTSVKDLLSMQLCAQKVLKHLQYGPVVVVVSATAGTTDKLIQEVEEYKNKGIELSKAATDMLITTGENISASMFSGVLASHGIGSAPMCAWQLPILTKDAVIADIKVDRILEMINNNIVPVITGFQGIEDNVLTSLDRGGSDISAVCIAKHLGLDTCYIYTDVPGIYRTSPSLSVGDNQLLAEINYTDSYKLAANGAKVVHKDAIRCAEATGMKIVVLSTFDTDTSQSTQIHSIAQKEYGVTCKQVEDGILVYVLHNQLISVAELDRLHVVGQTENDLHILFRKGSVRCAIEDGLVKFKVLG